VHLSRTEERDRGTSAVEYGLMIAAIAGVLVAVVFSLGSLVNDTFVKHSECFSSQLNSTSC
jgi:pilus assembly protein Flp/PilA